MNIIRVLCSDAILIFIGVLLGYSLCHNAKARAAVTYSPLPREIHGYHLQRLDNEMVICWILVSDIYQHPAGMSCYPKDVD